MKEDIDNITACDLACDAYGTSKNELAEVILKSDGDLFYAIKRINSLFNTELLQLQNDIITINIYGFNSISQKTANYSVEQFGEKNKVAAYMLKNLLDVQNRTNYPVLKEHISRIQIPAEEILLTLLPTIDSYHKFMRDNEMRDEIDYEEHEYHYDDEFTLFDEQLTNNKSESPVPDTTSEKANDTTAGIIESKIELETTLPKETTTEKVVTIVTTEKVLVETKNDSDEDQPRLIDQFINSDLPIEKLKEELEKTNQEENRGRIDANKGRAREIPNDNLELKGLYDADDLDYAGIRNVGRARLEQDAARNAYANKDDDYDYKNYHINTRDMDYSESEESKEDGDGRNAKPTETKPEPKPSENKNESSKPKPNNNPQTPTTHKPKESEESDETVQGRDFAVSDESDETPGSRDFFVPYESEEDDFDSIDQKSGNSKPGGFFSLMTNPIKKGLAGVLKFGRKAAGSMFDGVNKLAVSVITKPDNWFERVMNYPKNFAVLRMIDSIHLGKKWMHNVLNPMIDALEGKEDDSRGMNPFTAFTNPIKNSIRSFVRGIGNNIINSVGKIPFVGNIVAQGVNTTVLFFEGFLNRMMP